MWLIIIDFYDLHSNLQKIGINKFRDYMRGNWYGNSSKSGYETFHDVTHNISDLIDGFELRYQESRRKVSCKYASCFKKSDVGDSFFGRCFEIEIGKGNEIIDYIKVVIRKPLNIFIDLPHVFYNGIPSTRFMANTGENLWLEVSYEIFQTNFDDNCKKYSQTYKESFDACKFEAINKKIDRILNCSVPFLIEPNKTANICQNATVSRRAYRIYSNDRPKILPECPVPCVNMITSFGYPIIEKREDNKGKVYIFFKNFVKVSNDFISYDLLRYTSIFTISYFPNV